MAIRNGKKVLLPTVIKAAEGCENLDPFETPFENFDLFEQENDRLAEVMHKYFKTSASVPVADDPSAMEVELPALPAPPRAVDTAPA